MIHCNNGGRIVANASELPNFRDFSILYADWETTSGNPKEESTNPWRNCAPLGLAVAVDQSAPYYLPLGHHLDGERRGENLPVSVVREWWSDLLDRAPCWVNHNIKYDAHVSTNGLGVGVDRDFPLVDTLTLSKLFDSDMQYSGGYSLDNLSQRWLGLDIRGYEAAFAQFLGRHNKDYGAIPIDLLGAYACQDVLTTRLLFQFLQANCPEESLRVWNNEIKLTNLLYRMEQRGLCVDPSELKQRQFVLFTKLVTIEERLEKLVGQSFNPTSNDECFDVICNWAGCPVFSWTEGGKNGENKKPSFDKYALEQYLAYPYAPKEVIKLIKDYRHFSILNSFFVEPYIQQNINGVLHSTYNQCVRTGRMSCSEPNAMQLSKEAKELIHPRPGCSFWSKDASQIEFRLIAHYMDDPRFVDAYNDNPDVDFHTQVAEWADMPRKPAKNVNFMAAYGGGKEKTTAMLRNSPDVGAKIKAEIDQLIAEGRITEADTKLVFDQLATRRADELYRRYHAELPYLKRTSYHVARVCRQRGYVVNLLGRQRKLPTKFAHHGFNSINQSSAADIIKERMIELDEAYRDTPLEILVQVHDELLSEGPTELLTDPRTIADGIGLLERPVDNLRTPIRVPLRFSFGVSDRHWRAASSVEAKIPYCGRNVSPYPFSHIKGGEPRINGHAGAENISRNIHAGA